MSRNVALRRFPLLETLIKTPSLESGRTRQAANLSSHESPFSYFSELPMIGMMMWPATEATEAVVGMSVFASCEVINLAALF